MIDTAELYFNVRAERMIGEIIKNRRDKVVVATKVSRSYLRTKQIFDAVKNSLRRLGTDYIDLYL